MARKKTKDKRGWRRKGLGMISLRIPNHLLITLDSVATREDRARSKQIIRYIRQGLLNDGENIIYPTEE
jgi:metal-responsive CopG/Arc/MetJ family transcriptional regulator